MERLNDNYYAYVLEEMRSRGVLHVSDRTLRTIRHIGVLTPNARRAILEALAQQGVVLQRYNYKEWGK